ncbi:MAG: orotate phosphoribosyltransferase [Planctomycetaceae bacterium]|nr:orotate phosphoribosyltransferase [Planctomycetaceae bacterium]
MIDARKELLGMLRSTLAQGPVKLASGKMSDFYIDGRITSLDGRGLLLIGEAFYNLYKDRGLDAVGGPTLGADPIVSAVAYTFALKGKPINAFIIRKEPKGYGKQAWVEGPALKPGAKVAILEDVCTTGGSALKAIEGLRQQYEPEIVSVSCLVDRQEGAAEAFAKAGLKFEPLFTRKDFGK